jgi:hypothetical protein
MRNIERWIAARDSFSGILDIVSVVTYARRYSHVASPCKTTGTPHRPYSKIMSSPAGIAIRPSIQEIQDLRISQKSNSILSSTQDSTPGGERDSYIADEIRRQRGVRVRKIVIVNRKLADKT